MTNVINKNKLTLFNHQIAIPGPVGGKLIRQVVKAARPYGTEWKKAGTVWIAVSGGGDSCALAALLVRYGRKIAPPSKISLIHVHHGWRGKYSNQDASHVKNLAEKLGVRCKIVRVKPPGPQTSSWEEDARTKRIGVFQKLTQDGVSVVLTAHTREDLAETVLWRLCTGSFLAQSAGILEWEPTHRMFRPLLRTHKEDLKRFLKEEKIGYRTDASNHDPRFLRARLRKEVFPKLIRVFPRTVERLSDLGLSFQENQGKSEHASMDPLIAAIQKSGVKLRRGNYTEIGKWMKGLGRQSVLELPGGFRIRLEQIKKP